MRLLGQDPLHGGKDVPKGQSGCFPCCKRAELLDQRFLILAEISDESEGKERRRVRRRPCECCHGVEAERFEPIVVNNQLFPGHVYRSCRLTGANGELIGLYEMDNKTFFDFD